MKFFRALKISSLHTWFTFYKLNKLVKQTANRKVLKNFQPIDGNFLYVPASCLPYHISGYTTRTHEILKAISKAIEDQQDKANVNSVNDIVSRRIDLKATSSSENSNFSKVKLFVLTRTGYPWDRKDALLYPEDGKEYSVLDGIRYDHIRTPKNSTLTALYAKEASIEFEKYITKNRISCVHAASNHVNALPALIAAKRLGIHFQYEMRGLWELTRISRQPEFAKSHNFKLGLELEAFVAKHADKVFVISEQLSLYIQKNWGIPKEKISLLPNCADTDKIKPYEEDEISKGLNNNNNFESNTYTTIKSQNNSNSVVIGYAGSLIVYEGIQTLLKAMNILVFQKKMNIHLNVIGDGEYRKTLEELTLSLDLSGHVTFLGRLSPNEAKSKLDECAVICIPREPFDVCKVIPPIKLVESMAKGKCVVVPDLPVFIDELSITNVSNAPSVANDTIDTLNRNNNNNNEHEKVISEDLLPEVLSNNDSGCIFFRSGDEKNLADVLSNHLASIDDLKKRGDKARKYAISHRQWKKFAPLIIPMHH